MARIIKEFKETKPCALDPEEIEGFNPTQESDLNVARNNKFILVIDLPKCFRKLENTGDGRSCTVFKKDKLQMNVFGNILPEMEMESLAVPGWGQVPKVSSLARPAWKPININFTIDSKYENYYTIYKWMDLMNDTLDGGFDPHDLLDDPRGHLADYSTTFSLYALGEYNVPRTRWNMYGAFPTSLGSLNFNKREPNELECDFTYEFSFLKMELL